MLGRALPGCSAVLASASVGAAAVSGWGPRRPRALRASPQARDSESLWLDYFKLELVYVERLLARRRVLGLGGSGITGNFPDRSRRTHCICNTLHRL